MTGGNAPDPRGWLGSIVGAALSVLVAAISLYAAAELIRAAAPVLIVCGVLGATGWLVWFIHRHRSNGW